MPNCSLILPQRYKKDYEERFHSQVKSPKLLQEKEWIPGGNLKKKNYKTIDNTSRVKKRPNSVY